MSRQLLLALLTALAVVFLAPLPAAGQAADNWTPARTQDGHPDLQGYWTTQTFTPLERPEYLGDKRFYTEEEWSELQAQLTADGVDPLARSSIGLEDAEARETALHQTNRGAEYVHYDNAIWLATDVKKGLSTLR